MKNLSLLLFVSFLTFHGLSALDIIIPDANFKQALIDVGVDTGNDGEISQAEALAVTILSIHSKSISNLTGIGYFTNLEKLYCYNNSLTSMDVSGLTSLEVLYCYNNSLTSLDVSGITSLIDLRCYNNDLTSLDVSGLTSLLYLHCYNNSLTSLDVSGLTNLESLFCVSNSLYSIDIRNTPDLDFLYAHYNPDLECIVVDDVNELPAFTSVDPGFNNYTTEPCFSSFEGLPILVGSVGLPYATEAAMLATLGLAEEACSAGKKWLAVSSLTTLVLMTSRAQQLGRLTATEAAQILDAADNLIDDILSGNVDCSSGSPPNIFDWIASWFSLEVAGGGMAPGVNSHASIYPGSPDISVSPVLRIYPNPTAGRVHFSRFVNQVEVYNMVGQLMTKAENTDHLDLHAYQPGVYAIRLIDGGGDERAQGGEKMIWGFGIGNGQLCATIER